MAEARERTKGPLIIAPSVTGTRAADLADWRQAVFIGRSCEDSEHDLVAMIPCTTENRDEAESDAAYIVQAVNAHEKLVEALKLIAGGFESEGLEIENQWRVDTARVALSEIENSGALLVRRETALR